MNKYFLIIILAALFVGCGNNKVAECKPCSEALNEYLKQYPLSEPQDMYKLVFQDIYGPGHLITDSFSCAQYLLAEVDEMSDTVIMPLYEYTLCDSNFVRINLCLLRDGVIGIEQLTSAVMRSAEGITSPDPKFVMRHSQAFSEAYHPHYRIVRRDLFENEILPMIKTK